MNYKLLKFVQEKFKKPGSALDLGCGAGFDMVSLERLGWSVTGVDLKEGVDLNKPYKNKKVDLVYSNYVIQFIKNKKEFIDTCFNNLNKGGWVFIHTFDKSDRILKNKFSAGEIKKLFADKFENIKIEIFSEFDNDPRHRHWHKILELTAQRKEL